MYRYMYAIVCMWRPEDNCVGPDHHGRRYDQGTGAVAEGTHPNYKHKAERGG